MSVKNGSKKFVSNFLSFLSFFVQVQIQNIRATVTSSSAKKQHAAIDAFDNNRATFWHSDANDARPTLSITFEKEVLIEEIVVVKRINVPNRYQNMCVGYGVSLVACSCLLFKTF